MIARLSALNHLISASSLSPVCSPPSSCSVSLIGLSRCDVGRTSNIKQLSKLQLALSLHSLQQQASTSSSPPRSIHQQPAMPSIFAAVGPSPLAGTLFRVAALGSIAVAASKLILAPRTTSGLADQPLSDITAPAKASKLAYYQNIGWYLVGALVQLRWSYTGIHSVLDKAAFGLISLQYLSGGVGFLRLGFNAPAVAFATGLLPMLGALLEN